LDFAEGFFVPFSEVSLSEAKNFAEGLVADGLAEVDEAFLSSFYQPDVVSY
jgi:hypothetical protein